MNRKLTIDNEDYVELAGPYDPSNPQEMIWMHQILLDCKINGCKAVEHIDELDGRLFVYRQKHGWLTTDFTRRTTRTPICKRCGAAKEPRPIDGYPVCKKCLAASAKARYHARKEQA